MNLILPDNQIHISINFVKPVTQDNEIMIKKKKKKNKKTLDAGSIH